MTQERDIAQQVVELLDYGTSQFPANTAEQLRASRRKALHAAAVASSSAPVETALAGAGRVLHAHWRHPNYAVTALLLLALLLLASLVMKQHQAGPVEADTLILASELPPEAYVDQGFDAWLKRSSPP